MKTMRSRIQGVLAVALLPALALLGTTVPAQAGNLEPGTPTSLTIHKYAGDEGGPGDGSEIADPSGLGTPLSGVEFTITPVTAGPGGPIDLTTPQGWDRVEGATPQNVRGAGYTLGAPTVVTTGADGSVTQSLPQALYLVEETDPGDNNVVSPVAPFLVTLPLPDGAGGWTYDVHVYPKNQLNETEPTKSVADPGSLVLGAPVSWTINAPVPGLNSADSYRSFVITDTLDDRLDFVSATISNPGFAAGTHYTVADEGQTVTITLTAAGRGLLESGQVITAVINTTVESLGTDGVITNQATVNVNGSTTTTNEPSTNWGPLRVLKHVTGNTAQSLTGAVFAVYSDAAGSNQIGELTTGADGTASISLFVGNNDQVSRSYWIQETQAPTGYILDDQIREVTVQAGGETTVATISVPNQQRDGFELPLTGANGQLWLMVAGVALLLVAIGSGAVISSRRKKRAGA